jgi:hypothetical protein
VVRLCGSAKIISSKPTISNSATCRLFTRSRAVVGANGQTSYHVFAIVAAGGPARRAHMPPAQSLCRSFPLSGRRVDFCPSWPQQRESVSKVSEPTVAEIRAAVRQRLRQQRAVQPGQLEALMRKPCVQRLCLHLQLSDGKLHAIAPTGMTSCERPAPGRASQCPAPRGRDAPEAEPVRWPEMRCREAEGTRSRYCGPSSRLRQRGVSPPGWWWDGTYPHETEWHFAAAVNVSSCAGWGMRGDHNYIFSRLRLQSSLRLMRRAYNRLYKDGSLRKPLDLVMCIGETPITCAAPARGPAAEREHLNHPHNAAGLETGARRDRSPCGRRRQTSTRA